MYEDGQNRLRLRIDQKRQAYAQTDDDLFLRQTLVCFDSNPLVTRFDGRIRGNPCCRSLSIRRPRFSVAGGPPVR